MELDRYQNRHPLRIRITRFFKPRSAPQQSYDNVARWPSQMVSARQLSMMPMGLNEDDWMWKPLRYCLEPKRRKRYTMHHSIGSIDNAKEKHQALRA